MESADKMQWWDSARLARLAADLSAIHTIRLEFVADDVTDASDDADDCDPFDHHAELRDEARMEDDA